MVRCSSCGLRLRDEQPECPLHGPAAVPAPGASPEEAPRAEGAALADAVDRFRERGLHVDGELGRGGFGVVYRATRVADGRRVAIKVAHPERADAVDGLLLEIEALRKVGAPHVPELLEHGSLHGWTYAVLEYVAAPTLADRLVAQAGPMPLDVFTRLSAGILRSVAAIHGCGIVHRDLKPENIFITDRGEARIIDFGLARQLSSALAPVAVTEAGDDVGTAEYMSPEQCDGLSDADQRSDVYSLGALFYEMLTGAPPFFGRSAEVREAHRSSRPAPLLHKISCPVQLDLVIRTCLRKERADRYADVGALSAALSEALAAPTAPARQWPDAPTAQSAKPKAAAPAAAPTREKQKMGLLFFESDADLGPIRHLLANAGGQIVQTDGQQYVAAFGHELGDNPARIALVAAQRLFAGKLSLRLCVEVASVSVQVRPDGSRRLFSPLFAKKDLFPARGDREGITLTAAAAEIIPDLNLQEIPGRSDRLALELTRQSEFTSFGVHGADYVGQSDVVSGLLESATRAVLETKPTLVTVLGDAGYGRTHLARELLHQLRRLPPSDLVGLTAQEGIVGAVSQTLPDLLRRMLELPSEVPAGGGRQLLIERLGAVGEQVWAAAALSLGWIDASHPDLRRLAAAPGALRLAAARAAGEAIRRRSLERPTCIVLDDAHLADDATLDALEYATLKEASARVWVCVLARPGFERARPAWGTRAAKAHRFTLAPLAPADAMELARRLLLPVEYVPPAALQKLAERTQGVPRLLVELVRGLKRDGLVRRSERGSGYYLATDELEKLPDLPVVQWNAIREIEALPARLAGHARLSSVLGASFSVAEVEGLLAILEREELPEDMQLDAAVGIQRLVDAGLLVRHRSGQLDFRHSLLRDTVYQRVPEAQRKKLHRAAYEMYLNLPMPEAQRLPRLALQASYSGESEAAASAYLTLAERSMKAHAYLDAEVAFSRALEHLPPDDHERTIAASRGRGLMRFRVGRHEDALKDLRLARERAAALGNAERETELMLDESMVLDWTRDWVLSATLVRSVEARTEPRSELLAARLAMSSARVYHRLGDGEACVRLGVEAVERAEKLGDEGYETQVIALLLIGTDCANLGRLDEADRYLDMVLRKAGASADLLHVGAAYINRAFLWFARKDVDKLFADLARAAQVAREIGEPRLEYLALYNIGEVEYTLEHLERASEHTRRAIDLTKQLWGEMSRERATRELLLARIAVYGQQCELARELVERMRSRIAEARAQGLEEVDFFPSDRVLLDMVDLASRDATESEWEDFGERCRGVEMQPHEEVECIEFRALAAHRAGRKEDARRAFERAVELSTAKPNLLSVRVARKFAELFAS